jgi:hypothetical protein
MKYVSFALGLAASMWACSPNMPSQSSAAHTLSGVVSTTGMNVPLGMPIEGVRIQVEEGTALRLEATTDKNGRYTVSGLYLGSSSVSASKEGYDPYTRDLLIAGDLQLNIGVVPRPILTLAGVVSEVTPTGLAPLEGVLVNEGYKDHFSMTDQNGFYSISELYPSLPLYAGFTKAGYQSELRIVTINGDTRLDIQLVRR